MGLTISSLFTKLFGKKNMRILMGRTLGLFAMCLTVFSSGFGRCREDHHIIQVEARRNRYHNSNHR